MLKSCVAASVAVSLLALAMLAPPPELPPLPRPRPTPPPPDVPTVIESRWPVPVQTVSYIQPIQLVTPPPMATEPDLSKKQHAVKIARKRKIGDDDICRGKGRYYTHGGRSWRCVR